MPGPWTDLLVPIDNAAWGASQDDWYRYLATLPGASVSATAGYDVSIKSERELQRALDNSQAGVISVPKASSAYLIAMQNSGIFGSFSVMQDPLNPANYLIRASSFGGVALGGGVGAIAVAALVLVVLFSSRN